MPPGSLRLIATPGKQANYPSLGSGDWRAPFRLKDAGIESSHRAIIACLKAITEVLILQDERLARFRIKDTTQGPSA
jgi:hypothetical protein